MWGENMETSKVEFIERIVSFLGETGRDVFESIIDDEVTEAVQQEKKREIKNATAALYEAHLKDIVIIQLLQKYWNLEKYQAIESLRIEKTVKAPIKNLIAFMREQGYKTLEIKDFVKVNRVEEKLEANSTLWQLTPEKLMKEVTK
jgi:DNA-directed RNA polymerase delta subunit